MHRRARLASARALLHRRLPDNWTRAIGTCDHRHVRRRRDTGGRRRTAMRTLIGGALVALTLALSACGGSSSNSASEEALQRESDLYADQPDREVVPRGDLEEGRRQVGRPVLGACDRARSGPARRCRGRSTSRRSGSTRRPGSPRRTGCPTIPPTSSRSPSTATGARSTSNATSSTSTRVRSLRSRPGIVDVAKIDGRWLITNFVGSTSELKI